MRFPQPDLYFIVKEFYKDIERDGITDSSLSRFFDNCFNEVVRKYSLYKMWICTKCATSGKAIWDWGDKPKQCPKRHTEVYEISTFQARGYRFGIIFQLACYHLLRERFNIQLIRNEDRRHQYDFIIDNNNVLDAVGSAESIVNYNGKRSVLSRPGMGRTDTERKAFENAHRWLTENPTGNFFILTNRLPSQVARTQMSPIVLNVTKADQLQLFVNYVSEPAESSTQ